MGSVIGWFKRGPIARFRGSCLHSLHGVEFVRIVLGTLVPFYVTEPTKTSIGSGISGRVILGTNASTLQTVAIKTLLKNDYTSNKYRNYDRHCQFLNCLLFDI